MTKKYQQFLILLVIIGIVCAVTFSSITVYKIPLIINTDIKQLECYRNYATIISSCISSLVGVLGIIAGVVYYVGRKTFDNEKQNKDYRHNLYRLLLNEIENCDDVIERLYHKQTVTSEIKLLLDDILKRTELILSFIEDNEEKLGLNQIERRCLIHWLSFIGNSKISRIQSLRDISPVILSERGVYTEQYKKVKVLLMSK